MCGSISIVFSVIHVRICGLDNCLSNAFSCLIQVLVNLFEIRIKAKICAGTYCYVVEGEIHKHKR